MVPDLKARKCADMVAAGILPVVEPGFQPGGKNIKSSEATGKLENDSGGKIPPSM
jgi:hypothetical protein